MVTLSSSPYRKLNVSNKWILFCFYEMCNKRGRWNSCIESETISDPLSWMHSGAFPNLLKFYFSSLTSFSRMTIFCFWRPLIRLSAFLSFQGRWILQNSEYFRPYDLRQQIDDSLGIRLDIRSRELVGSWLTYIPYTKTHIWWSQIFCRTSFAKFPEAVVSMITTVIWWVSRSFFWS